MHTHNYAHDTYLHIIRKCVCPCRIECTFCKCCSIIRAICILYVSPKIYKRQLHLLLLTLVCQPLGEGVIRKKMMVGMMITAVSLTHTAASKSWVASWGFPPGVVRVGCVLLAVVSEDTLKLHNMYMCMQPNLFF